MVDLCPTRAVNLTYFTAFKCEKCHRCIQETRVTSQNAGSYWPKRARWGVRKGENNGRLEIKNIFILTWNNIGLALQYLGNTHSDNYFANLCCCLNWMALYLISHLPVRERDVVRPGFAAMAPFLPGRQIWARQFLSIHTTCCKGHNWRQPPDFIYTVVSLPYFHVSVFRAFCYCFPTGAEAPR